MMMVKGLAVSKMVSANFYLHFFTGAEINEVEDDIMMTNGQKTRNLTQLVELPILRCEVDCEMRNMF